MPITARPDAPPLEVSGLAVTVPDGRGGRVPIARADRLAIAPGARIGIAGPSGSGKTTLLHALAGLLRPDAGRIAWGGDDLARMGEAARDRWRRRRVGIVFQDFHLVPELSALDNVRISAWFGGLVVGEARTRRAQDLLARVGIADARIRAGRLSRGEQQRVAIARALFAAPPVLLADEPTASLDAATGAAVADLLLGAAEDAGVTLVIVSHDPALLARLERVHRMAQGVLAA